VIFPSALQAYVCRDRVDMRRGVDGLLQLVGQSFGRDPFGGQMFIFIGKRRDKAKLLWWHHTGFLLLYKRLERGRFPDPQALATRGLSMAEVMAFLEGIDLSRARRIAPVPASRVA
jgi:transposase